MVLLVYSNFSWQTVLLKSFRCLAGWRALARSQLQLRTHEEGFHQSEPHNYHKDGWRGPAVKRATVKTQQCYLVR